MLGLMSKHGIDKPLWITECGGRAVSDRAKAMQWLRTVVQWPAAGVKGVIQYELFDYPHDGHPPTYFLMRSADHMPTPFFQAYQQMIRALTGAKPQPLTRRPPEGIKLFSFRRGHEQIYVAWSNSSAPQPLKLTFARTPQEIEFIRLAPFCQRMVFAPQASHISFELEPLGFVIISAR